MSERPLLVALGDWRLANLRDAVQLAILETYVWAEGAGSYDVANAAYADAVEQFCLDGVPVTATERERLYRLLTECARALSLPELHPEAWTLFVRCPECGSDMGDHSLLGCPEPKKPYEPPRLVPIGADDPRAVILRAELES